MYPSDVKIMGTDGYSEWLLFRKVLFCIMKGYYSKDFYVHCQKVITPKIFIPNGHYSEFRNNDPSG